MIVIYGGSAWTRDGQVVTSDLQGSSKGVQWHKGPRQDDEMNIFQEL